MALPKIIFKINVDEGIDKKNRMGPYFPKNNENHLENDLENGKRCSAQRLPEIFS